MGINDFPLRTDVGGHDGAVTIHVIAAQYSKGADAERDTPHYEYRDSVDHELSLANYGGFAP